MTKRDTVGGPRKRKQSQEDIERREGYLSRSERERQMQRRILYGAAGVGIVVVIIIIAALLYDNVVLPAQPITTIDNDQEISINDFRDRVQFERFQLAEQIRAAYQQRRIEGMEADAAAASIEAQTQDNFPVLIALSNLVSPDAHAREVLNRMETERVIEIKAEEFGLTDQVDRAAIDAEVNELIAEYTERSLTETPAQTETPIPSETPTPLVSPTPSPIPSETPTPTATIQPTLEGCAEGEECPTVTPLPTSPPTEPPTSTPEVTETLTPTATPTETLEPGQVRATVETFRDTLYEEGADVSGLDEEAIRQVFYYQALENALRDYVTSNSEQFPDEYVNPMDIQVKARHILIGFPGEETGVVVPAGDENEYYEEAVRVLEALEGGAPFAVMAIAHSDDPGSTQTGGMLTGAGGGTWTSAFNYVPEFQDAVISAPLGEFVGPIRTDFGYHIIQVMDREERAYPPGQYENLQAQAFQPWLENAVLTTRIQRRQDWENYIPDDPTFEELVGDILPDLAQRLADTADQ